MEENDASDGTFPKSIWEELLTYFNMNGYGNVTYLRNFFFQTSYFDSKIKTWSKSYIENMMEQVEKRNCRGTYGVGVVNMMKDILSNWPVLIAGRRILVMGSESPWIEVILLLLGATEVTTLEYATIVSDYPSLKSITPSEFWIQYNNGSLIPYEIIVSHSSLEHPGYGDAWNPWGDLIAVARVWCITKPGGYLLLGLPTGIDAIKFNAHRVYGK
jgi:Caenorhabditis protein of unknown function, DUF268